MTTLAAGSSVTLIPGDGGSVTASSNWGEFTVTETPIAGVVKTSSYGPRPVRVTFDPYKEGATVVIASSNAVVDYETNGNTPADKMTAAEVAATQALVSGGGNVASRPMIGALGDSRAASAIQPVSTAYFTTNDWLPSALALSGAAYRIGYFGGVNGNTVAQMLARVPDVIASGAKYCTVLGGTNDAWTTSAMVDASFATMQKIYEQLNAAGIYVFALSEMPCVPGGGGTSAWHTTGWHDLAGYYNDKISTYWRGRNGGEYVDVWSQLVLPATGIGDTIYFYDGLHPGIQGSDRIAPTVSARLRRLVSAPWRDLIASPRDIVSVTALSTNVAPNPLMAGTGGTIGAGNSGQLPDGYNGGGGNTTSTYSVVARSDGVGNDWKAVITGTSSQTLLAYQTLDQTKFVAGSQWVIDCELIVEACSNLNRFSVQCQSDGWQFGAFGSVNAAGGLASSTTKTYTISSPTFTVPTTPAYVLLCTDVRGASGSSWSATIRMGRVSCRRVA